MTRRARRPAPRIVMGVLLLLWLVPALASAAEPARVDSGDTAWLLVSSVKVVSWTVGLRVTREEEREGLDVTQHGEQGYIM